MAGKDISQTITGPVGVRNRIPRKIIIDHEIQPPAGMITTDLAGRGLDFSLVSHVINYDFPWDPVTYTHRTNSLSSD